MRFVVVGGTSFVLDAGSLFLLHGVLKLWLPLATVLAYAVSFIAPHSLTARALVVAPSDVLTVQNRSRDEPADVTVDGRPTTELPAGESFNVRFIDAQSALAQIPGASFYNRLREKFGRLAN